MRHSKPVLTAPEIEAKLRAELVGQPQAWVDDAIVAERARQAEAQAKYDKTPPARAYTPPPEV